MYPPDPFQPQLPTTGPASPAAVATALAGELARLGLTSIYAAAADTIAVVSVAAGLTAWTDGRHLWCTHGGQRHTWSAADTGVAAARLAVMARQVGGS